ncbi:TetR/AcrR family transcriptional regulator [Mycolicibacterium sp.]|uniref:TetR/AcrR family transcriptional regulator n=1 Tax=Mycolicibacterium sp. TaxID=2320850 RepID=UPI003D112DE9
MSNDQRRLELINAAVGVIAELGVVGATTRRIADRAGAPLTMIHYCFKTKEDLYHAIFEHLTQVQFDSRIHVRPGVGLGLAAASLMRQVGAWTFNNDTYAKAQTELFMWMTRQSPDVARKIYAASVDVIARKLREGIRPDDDDKLVESLARIILSYGDGSVVHDAAFKDESIHMASLESMAEALEHLANAHRTAVQTQHPEADPVSLVDDGM